MIGYELGSAHDGWKMLMGEERAILLAGAVEDGLPDYLVDRICEVYKTRTAILGEMCAVQYWVEIDGEKWAVNGSNLEFL